MIALFAKYTFLQDPPCTLNHTDIQRLGTALVFVKKEMQLSGHLKQRLVWSVNDEALSMCNYTNCPDEGFVQQKHTPERENCY